MPTNLQPGVRVQQAVARGHLVLPAGHLRVQVHVVLRMRLEVLAVVVDRHPVQRQPAVVRLALVVEQRDARGLHVVEHRLQARVVQHHELALRIAQRHAHVLPHLDAHRAGAHLLVDAALGALEPAGRLEVGHREGAREGHRRRGTRVQRDGHAELVVDGREVRVVDVDRQHLEVLAPARPRRSRPPGCAGACACRSWRPCRSRPACSGASGCGDGARRRPARARAGTGTIGSCRHSERLMPSVNARP